ncbi:hypothetical protein ABZ635_22220 [Nocardiopsis sp. NPDC007018]|uniref:hypothetical protein n=1 Tax=Nocardiopsis sp. NPDC007018 TaxID=3155721 RepID=UPI00340EE9B0
MATPELIVTWDHDECPFPVRVDAYIGGVDNLYRVTSPDTGGTWDVPESELIGIR